MLVGLTKKNGIMMVDFALEAKQNQNLSAKEANIRSCLICFRLIIMTTLVALVATISIPLWLGPKREARSALGIAVVAGLFLLTTDHPASNPCFLCSNG